MIPKAMLAVAYATGRASHARQAKGNDTDKKVYPGPPGWGFGGEANNPTLYKKNYETSKKKRRGGGGGGGSKAHPGLYTQ